MSPLRRTLETAVGAFGGGPVLNGNAAAAELLMLAMEKVPEVGVQVQAHIRAHAQNRALWRMSWTAAGCPQTHMVRAAPQKHSWESGHAQRCRLSPRMRPS